jgi:hypothetical protein
MMRRSIFLLLPVLAGGICSRAEAELIVATETVTGSGVLDGTPFTNALVTLSGTFDTTLVVSNSFFADAHAITTVTVGGVSDTLTAPFFGATEVFSTPGRAVGFTVAAGGDDVLDTTTTANAGYFLQGPSGPFSGPAIIQAGKHFATSAGPFFELDSVSTDAAMSFTGGAAPTPEPGSLTLACIGAVSVGFGAFRRLRHRKAV